MHNSLKKTLKIDGFLKIYHTDEVGMINMQFNSYSGSS